MSCTQGLEKKYEEKKRNPEDLVHGLMCAIEPLTY